MHTRDTILSLYVSALGLLAVALLVTTSWNSLSTSHGVAFAALVTLGLLTEAFTLRDDTSATINAVSFVPFLAAVVLLGPAWAMAVAGLTEVVAEGAMRRRPLIKITHNTSKEIVGVGLAGLIYVALGGVPSVQVFTVHVPAFILAVAVYFVVGNGAVTTAVALSGKVGFREGWSRLVGRWLIYDMFASSMGLLLAFLYIQLGLLGFAIIAIPLFFVRHVNSVNLQLEQAGRDTLELMVKAIEARDRYTSGHSLRVSKYAKILAQEMGLSPSEVERIEHAAMLHDVGKIYEEFAPLLQKSGKLTPEEQELMESHPAKGAELAATVTSLRGYIESCIRSHHERFDGKGYPDGLQCDQIPLGARVITVADTIDAMATERPYRAPIPYGRVVAEVTRCSCTHFDPQVVAAFQRSTMLHKLLRERRSREPRKRMRWGKGGAAVTVAG